jgi:hypothetical protein
MKTTNENEMDLLLRAVGRDASARSATGSLQQSSHEIGEHLDADELNCYAERIVTGAERLRYVKHLADCDRCRSIVAGLVPAMTQQREAVKLETGWSWREKLAALFAPSVMRFAVPALALTAIIGIAIVVLRRPQRTDFVAQNQQQTPGVSTGGETQTITTRDAPQAAASPGQQPLAGSKEKTASSEERPSAIQSPVVAPKTRTGTATTDHSAQGIVQPSDSSVAQSQPTFAAEPTEAAAPPPPAPATLDASKTAEARKKDNEADLQKPRDDGFSRSRTENEVARVGSAKGGPSRNNSNNLGGYASVMSRSADKDEKAAGNAAETRKVSGRMFHREGNVWVDSSYDSGRATVNVKRGSEQFRALIADEPALRSIAEQLGGEVIVVWKGTAYRIR